jgi:hypothetical protein
MTQALRQESVVELGGRQLTVESELVLDPEVMVVTQVHLGEKILRKTHVALPPAAVRDFEHRGIAALTSSLYACHLRFVRKLLSATPEPTAAPRPAPAGVLGTIILDGTGQVVSSAGEEHVPGGWLRAAYLTAGLADVLSERLDLGPLREAHLEGESLSALVVRTHLTTRIAFLGGAGERPFASALAHLEGLA